MTRTLTSPDTIRLQRRTVATLVGAQILGGVGFASGVTVGALLAADLSSDALSGLSSSMSVVGAAIIALPVTHLMTTAGRRQGLLLAYILAILGAILIVGGAKIHIFAIVLPGMFLFGGASTATLQNRYAATDLAQPKNRGRDLSTVVWATTIGSVTGPNLAERMGVWAESHGLPPLSGPYVLSAGMFVLALTLLQVMLRPDPLLIHNEIHGIDHEAMRKHSVPLREAMQIIWEAPAAKVGLAAMALGQAVMTAVMSMTPIHMKHADASTGIIGAIISGHIAGMYIASPLVGMATDRIGRRPVIMTGIIVLFTSFVLAGTATGHQHTQLMIGLFLLGLGWSCTMIAGSTLLTETLPSESIARAQGAADLTMGLAGASAGVIAGLIIWLGSYAMLNLICSGLIIWLTYIVVRERISAARVQIV